MTRIHPLTRNLGPLALVACALLLLPAPAGAADQDLITIDILVDGDYVGWATTPIYEPITLQMDPRSPVLGIYPEYVDLRGEHVTLAIYEVDDLRDVRSRNLIESIDVNKTDAVALDGAAGLVNRTVELRLRSVVLATR